MKFFLYCFISIATIVAPFYVCAETFEQTLAKLPPESQPGFWGAFDDVLGRTNNFLGGVNKVLGAVSSKSPSDSNNAWDEIVAGVNMITESVGRNIIQQRKDLLNQAEILEKKIHAGGADPTETVDDRILLADCYSKLAQYDRAAKVIWEYLDDAYTKQLDKTKPAEIASLLNQLADIYALAGKDVELKKLAKLFENLNTPEAPALAALAEARRFLNIMDVSAANESMAIAVAAINDNKISANSMTFGLARYLIAALAAADARLDPSQQKYHAQIQSLIDYSDWISANCKDIPKEYYNLTWELVENCCRQGDIEVGLELAQNTGAMIQKIHPDGSVEELSYLLALGDLAYANNSIANKVNNSKLDNRQLYYYRGTKMLADRIWKQKEERASNPILHKINRRYARALADEYLADKKKAFAQKPENPLDFSSLQYKKYASLDSVAKAHLRMSRYIYENELNDYRREIHDRFLQLTERERITYKQNLSALISDIYNFAEIDDNKTTRNMVYDASLLNKAILLGLSQNLHTVIADSGDSDLQRLYSELIDLRAEFLKTQNTDINDAAVVANLNNRIQAAEIQLMDRLSLIDGLDAGAFINTTCKDIRQTLDKKSKDIAIEFYDFNNRFTGIRSQRMVAVRRDKDPEIFKLNPSPNHIDKPVPDDAAMRHYSDVIWKPMLKKWLTPGASIYFSTSGIWNMLPIEFVPSPDGKGNMNDFYRLYRVSTTRNAAKVNVAPALDGANAVLFGDLAYTVRAQAELPEPAEPASATRGGSTTFFNPLSFTKEEIDEIGDILTSAGVSVTPFEGNNGIEERFKDLSGKDVSILHLATHGAYDGTPAAASESADELERSMSLSYLAMSGVNNPRRLRSLNHTDSDGKLTAREISLLDLGNVDLVVMSACESGLGQINADGVFGLQRGFKLAGAKTLIMSLWKVNDKATRVMMTEFYKALANGDNKTSAFRKAQQAVRQGSYPDYDSDGNPLPDRPGSEPAIWSAFVILD